MDKQLTATIIPFPGRPRGGSELGQSAERLSTALTGLSSALAEQREALQRWRSALAELHDRMQTLGGKAG